MFAMITPGNIQLPPGAVVRLPGSWEEYQILSQELGDSTSPRLKYRPGEILLTLCGSPDPQRSRVCMRSCQSIGWFLLRLDILFHLFNWCASG